MARQILSKKDYFLSYANEDYTYIIDVKEQYEEKGDYLKLSDVEELDELFSEAHPKLVILTL